MTQHVMTTKPIGDTEEIVEDPAAATAALAQRPRRRLGAWQLDPPDSATAGLPTTPAPEGSTIPLEQPVPDAATAEFAPSPVDATTPIALSNSVDPTAPIVLADASATLPLTEQSTVHAASQPTAPMAASASTAELLKTIRLRGVDIDPRSDTAPMAPASVRTAPIAAEPTAATAPMERVVGDQTIELTHPVSEEDKALAVTLRDHAALNPTDSDALFELAVVLHRAGERREARGVLSKLVGLYEERGQHTQAARIKSMLSAPKTGPIATEDLPPHPVASDKTIPLVAKTTQLAAQPTGAIGRPTRAQSRLLTPPAAPQFTPETLVFTIPLPGEQRLPAEVRELVAQSSEDLRAGKLNASYDLCLYAINLAPDYVPLYLRITEIYTAQRLSRRARTQGETLLRLVEATGETQHLWMIYRVLLHTTDQDLPSLRRLVELLIEAGQTEQASFYASKLIQLLDSEGLAEEAAGYAERLCGLIPGDTRAALESVILMLKGGNRGGAVDRWEAAVAAGADPTIAKASMAAIMTAINEDDHWRMLADVITHLRSNGNTAMVDAYLRTAAVEAPTTTLQAGEGLLLAAVNDDRAHDLLAAAAGDRSGSGFARATSAVALAWRLKNTGQVDEYVSAIRTATKLLESSLIASNGCWVGLVGRAPRFEDLSLELGEALLNRHDAAGAAEVLKEAHSRHRHHGALSDRLAEAYFRIGQLGAALTILDELAAYYRTSGQLESMAGVLRQMSQLAPNNIKVKSRLIDAYLQRGFVAEARAELIQRADLEERSGLIKDAISSLQRAADLSWTMGLADETFSLYHRMIALSPGDVGNRHGLVNLYLQLGRLDDAAAHQRAVVDLALKQDTKHEAIAALHQVIGLTPDDTSAYYQLGDLLTSIGEYGQAEKVYKRLVLMNPADAIAQAKATTMAALSESARSQA